MLKGFDKHLQEMLRDDAVFAREYAKVFAELPLQTQLAIMRRRRMLSQRSLAKKMKVFFEEFPHWLESEQEERDLRKELNILLATNTEDMDKPAKFIDYLFDLLKQAARI